MVLGTSRENGRIAAGNRGDYPNIRGEDGVVPEKEPPRRENGTVPFGPDRRSSPARHNVAWYDLLAKSSTAMEGTLLVDWRAMARAGIGPESLVAAVPPDLASAHGAALLQQAGLVLLLSRDNLLLTSAVEAALDHDCLAPIGVDTALAVLPGPLLANRLNQAAEKGNDRDFAPIEVWKQMPPAAGIPWGMADLAGRGPTDALGWTACRVEIPAPNNAFLYPFPQCNPVVRQNGAAGGLCLGMVERTPPAGALDRCSRMFQSVRPLRRKRLR